MSSNRPNYRRVPDVHHEDRPRIMKLVIKLRRLRRAKEALAALSTLERAEIEREFIVERALGIGIVTEMETMEQKRIKNALARKAPHGIYDSTKYNNLRRTNELVAAEKLAIDTKRRDIILKEVYGDQAPANYQKQ